MVPAVRQLEFQLGGQGAWKTELSSQMRVFFDTISTRMSYLSSLSITALFSIDTHSARFIGLLAHTLEGLQNLEYVVLPPRVIVGKVIISLSHHPKLLEINPATRGLSREEYSTASNVAPPKLEGSCFPSLRNISFCAIPRNFRAFLSHPHFPGSQILSLHVQVLESSRASEHEPLDHLMKAISANCPNIGELSVSETIGANDNETALPFTSIHGILDSSRLTNLKIRVRACLMWTAQEVDEFASSLPSARTLLLNETPSEAVQPVVTIEAALSTFARHCPELRQLGFCFDARSQRQPKFGHSQLSRFKSLVALHVGASPIDDNSDNLDNNNAEDIAAFLIAILPVECKLRWSYHGGEWGDDDEADDESFAGSPWQRVRQLQNLCKKVHRLLSGRI
ncbi:hypothetical protein Hypma_016580 [Hypsizygus marmoreus]|uniref:F-box domain-containing protein n=1 Tax=Hypsizygus marmoreus TaxID=39966 RepID=A0A369J7I1_HYPMA|nr:hypothetical protein Hypma_016580 [Hypsizygus marmoreus]